MNTGEEDTYDPCDELENSELRKLLLYVPVQL